jgi:hypothetical protein
MTGGACAHQRRSWTAQSATALRLSPRVATNWLAGRPLCHHLPNVLERVVGASTSSLQPWSEVKSFPQGYLRRKADLSCPHRSWPATLGSSVCAAQVVLKVALDRSLAAGWVVKAEPLDA